MPLSPSSPEDNRRRLEFIGRFLTWTRGSNVLETSLCLVLNFGWTHDIPFAQLKLSEDSTVSEKLFWRTGPFRSPNSCSVVFIGSKYLDKVSKVMAVVDGVSEYMQMMPFAIFLDTEKAELETIVDRSSRHNISPLVVELSNSSLVQLRVNTVR